MALETVAEIRRSNLKKLAMQAGSQRALATRLQRTTQQISDLIGGRRPFGERLARAIEETLGLTQGELDRNLDVVSPFASVPHPPIERPDAEASGRTPDESIDDFSEASSATTLTIPSLDAQQIDGLKNAPKQIDFVEKLEVTKSWFYAQKIATTAPRALRIISAASDNMMPSIAKGDVVFVDLHQNTFDAPGVYAVEYLGTIFLNRVQLLPDGTALLLSDNAAYPPIPTHGGHEVTIIGKCIGVLNAREL